jgi:hypothetical protein
MLLEITCLPLGAKSGNRSPAHVLEGVRILKPTIHGVLDYVTILIFALAPTLLQLSGTAMIVCYVLAAAHLLLTAATKFPLGLIKVLAFQVHGMVEFFVALFLLVGGYFLGGSTPGKAFLIGAGAVILIVFVTTDYAAE